MAFDERDDLLRRIDLAKLLDEFSPGERVGHGRSARWRCIDTEHDDEHPSVSMAVGATGIEFWQCWSGGHGGTAIDAVLAARGGSTADAIRELRRRAGLALTRAPDVPSRPTFPPPSTPVVGLGHADDRGAASGRDEPGSPERPHPAVLDYVDRCARMLWQPPGRAVLDYLVTVRGLRQDVLLEHHVGADPGPERLHRLRGMPRGGPAAVLPTHDATGSVTYVQLRYVDPPPQRSKYDNPSRVLARNPRLTWVTPAHVTDPGRLVVCEGTIDALSVAGRGIAAVALLSAAYVDREVAAQIADTAGERKVVLALDGDRAGRSAADALRHELAGRGTAADLLAVPDGADLNVCLADSRYLFGLREPDRSLGLGRG